MTSMEISGYQLAREIGTSDMSISKYRAAMARSGFEFFEKLVTRYPAINLNWLIGRQGDMFLDPSIKPKHAKIKVQPRDLLESKNELIALQSKSPEMMEERIRELAVEFESHRIGKKVKSTPQKTR